MRQASKLNSKIRKKTVKGNHGSNRKKRGHKQEFGTSKLECDFAHEYLDELGLKYVYQFEAKGIKRFFDFAVTAEENYPYKYKIVEGVDSIDQDAQMFIPSFLIEVDGDYYHGNHDFVSEDKLSPMQKHNMYVDKLKDEWCALHSIPLLRIWEHDIRKNPKKVFEMLGEYSLTAMKRQKILENKRKPH